LSIFSEKEYFELMDKINSSPGALFDFRKREFSEIKQEYLEYF